MSDTQEKTARLIAEAQALLEKAQQSQDRAADVFRLHGMAAGRVDEQTGQRLSASARAAYEQELQRRLASPGEIPGAPLPMDSGAGSRPYRPRKPRTMI